MRGPMQVLDPTLACANSSENNAPWETVGTLNDALHYGSKPSIPDKSG